MQFCAQNDIVRAAATPSGDTVRLPMVKPDLPLNCTWSKESQSMLEAVGILFILISSVGISYLLMLTVFKLIALLQLRVSRANLPVRE